MLWQASRQNRQLATGNVQQPLACIRIRNYDAWTFWNIVAWLDCSLCFGFVVFFCALCARSLWHQLQQAASPLSTLYCRFHYDRFPWKLLLFSWFFYPSFSASYLSCSSAVSLGSNPRQLIKKPWLSLGHRLLPETFVTCQHILSQFVNEVFSQDFINKKHVIAFEEVAQEFATLVGQLSQKCHLIKYAKKEKTYQHTKILGNLWPNFVSWQIRLATLYEVLQSFLCTLIPLNDVYFNDSNFRSNEHISKFFYSYRTKVIPCPKPNLSNFVVNIFGGEAALPAQTSPLGYSLSQFAISVLDLQPGTPFPPHHIPLFCQPRLDELLPGWTLLGNCKILARKCLVVIVGSCWPSGSGSNGLAHLVAYPAQG